MSDDVSISKHTGGAIERVDDAEISADARAVRAYVLSQLSPRSRGTALDALRRIVRLVSGNPTAPPEAFAWTRLDYEKAMALRTLLYERSREGAITPGTANLTLSHLRGLIRAMYAMHLINPEQLALAHPGMLKNIPGTREARGRALSASEERVMRAATSSLRGYQGVMLNTAVVLAIGAGLRREEVAHVELDRLEPGMLSIVGKGNKERQLVVDEDMQRSIDAWLAVRATLAPDHGLLFCSPQRPDWTLSPWSFWSLVRSISHRAFGDKSPCEETCRCIRVVTGPHDFRRTFATRLLDQGYDIRQVQVLMGHSSPETTARYDKRALDQLLEKRRRTKIIA